MKKTMMILTGAMVLAFFANCGKNDDGPKGGAIEMSGACYNIARMNTQNAWGTQTQQPYGAAACSYPYTSAINSGMTNANASGAFSYTMGGYGANGVSMCGGTTSQAYSPTKGMACVQNTQITLSGQPVVYDLNPLTQNFTPSSVAIPNFAYQSQYQGQYQGQYGYQQTYPYTTMGTGSSYLPQTATQTYRVCDTSEPCPGSQTCRSALGPYSGTGLLGICYF